MKDFEFDNALRQRHVEAVAQVSTRTRVQLRNRLAASAAKPRHAPRRAAWAAAACATVFALVMGLQHRPQPASTPASATAVMDDNQAGNDAPYPTLDENPDFYVGLASNDAVTLASE